MSIKIFILALLFGLTETAYFGWNLTPQSDAEVVCDGITFLIGTMAFIGGTK